MGEVKKLNPQQPVNQQSNDIIVDDASKVFNIKNKQGDLLGQFRFRPTDTNIIKRYDEVIEALNNLGELPEDGYEAMKAVEKRVVDQVSYLIGADAGQAFFTVLGPFSSLESGELFIENVLGAISGVIEREMNVRMKRMRRRQNKYTKKYHK